MAKIGRNDPCHCGSGKKYKNCHLPIEEAAQQEQRRLQLTQDALLTKLIEAAEQVPEVIPAALERYWNGKYTLDQLPELDDLEDRGGERFLIWMAFDYRLDDGKTLVERLADDPGELELSDDETRLLKAWTQVRLRPYTAEVVLKGQEITVRDLLDDAVYRVQDHAASRRVEPGEVLVAHLVPVGDRFFIAGTAGHLTSDTSEKLREFADLHLEAYRREHPNADWADLLREHSEVQNHFIMALPTEEPDPTIFDTILMQTREALQLMDVPLEVVKSDDEAQGETPDAAQEQTPEEQ